MELRTVVRNRRSIRKYLPKPVNKEVIQELVADAIWAPSWGNVQPWEVVAVVGPTVERFREENQQAILSGKAMNPDIPMPGPWSPLLKKRYEEVTKGVYGALSIERTDKEARFRHLANMFHLFDAPAFMVLVQDADLPVGYPLMDMGLFLQTFCLLAHGKGLGTCVLTPAVLYPDIVRKHLSIPESRRIVMGVTIGYPDWDAPVNQFERTRGSVEEFLRIVD